MNTEITLELGSVILGVGLGALVICWIAWFWGVLLGKRYNGNALIMKDEFFKQLGYSVGFDHTVESFDSRRVDFDAFGLGELAERHQLRAYRYGNVVAVLDLYNERLYVPYFDNERGALSKSVFLLKFLKGEPEFGHYTLDNISQLAQDIDSGAKTPIHMHDALSGGVMMAA